MVEERKRLFLITIYYNDYNIVFWTSAIHIFHIHYFTLVIGAIKNNKETLYGRINFKTVGENWKNKHLQRNTNTHFMGKHMKDTICLRDVTFKSFELTFAVGLLRIHQTSLNWKICNHVFICIKYCDKEHYSNNSSNVDQTSVRNSEKAKGKQTEKKINVVLFGKGQWLHTGFNKFVLVSHIYCSVWPDIFMSIGK